MAKLNFVTKGQEAKVRKLLPRKLMDSTDVRIGSEICRSKTLAELKSRKGNVIPAGTEVMVFQHERRCEYFFAVGAGTQVAVNWGRAHIVLEGFNEPPTMDELEYMVRDSVSTTPFDDTPTEHDGSDEFGFYSWVRILIGI